MKYVKVEWPEIQYYMNHPKYLEEVGYDPTHDYYFVPEDWEPEDLGLSGDIGDLEDALG